MRFLVDLKRRYPGFPTNIGGNVAVLFAIAAIPVLTAVGCAVDYSLATSAYAKLQSCADSAVVAAVSQQGMASDATRAKTSMLSWFDAVCRTNSASNLVKLTISSRTGTVKDSNGARTASLSFKASRANSFLSVVGLSQTGISGAATAGSAPTKTAYTDIYALLDDSPSMGLASTTAGQAKLKSLTASYPSPDHNCQFACHLTSGAPANQYPDIYTIAKNNSVELRIEVLRDSWIGLINQAKNAPSANVFRYATYTFDSHLNTVQNLTGSAAAALASANTIDLAAADYYIGAGSSFTDNALQSMVPIIPAAGDGSSAANSKKYLIFVTDGVQDKHNCSYTWCHQTGALTASNCDAIKSKGVQIAVIYTTYLPMPSDHRYVALVQPFASQIAPALQACASAGLFFEADQASDISNAFNTILARITSGARLTN